MASTGDDQDRPTGVVTFLFTDVEGSTEAWEADPGAMARRMRRHHELIDEVAAKHEGVRAVEQGAGDSTVIAFARAALLRVATAVEIQQRLAIEPWDGPPLRVRMAVHTGEVDVWPDGTYQGHALNRCGRLLAAAHAAQVITSAATRDLCLDAMADTVDFRSLGRHRLRGIEQPMLVFQVEAEGIERNFPPLRTLDGTPHNLPPQFTSFVGHDDDRRAVAALVEEHRLVSLIGSGGCGKTRLSIEVCAELIDRFDDGIWFVDLAPLSGADAVGLALADVLGVPVPSDRRPVDAIVRWLDAQRCIVVLDNCEHLLDECAALADGIRGACSGVQVITTSREPLGVAGEVVWRIPSLSTDESMTLFVDRARLVRADFTPTLDDRQAISAICDRLDGIPLAIELAAALVRTLSPDDIAARLDDRFELLTGGGRVVLPRQRTLEASVSWSHQLLDDDERAVLRRLSVFAGGFTVEGAERVVAGGSVAERDVLRLVTQLADKSLVSVVSDEEGRPRHGMLETVRQFGRERLIDDEGIEGVRDRHLAWFVEWTDRVGSELEGPRTVEFLGQIEPEAENVQAALRWAERRGDWESMARILGSLVWFWLWRVQLRTTWEWLDRLEPHLDEVPAPARLPALWCRLWMSSHYLGRHDLIEASHDALLDAARSAGDAKYEARALAVWGVHVSFYDGDLAGTLIDDAVDVARRAGDSYIECYALSGLALRDVFVQRARPALDQLARESAQVRATGSPQLMAEHRSWQCAAEWQAGELVAARRSVDTILEVYRPISEINIVGIALQTGLWLDLCEGRPVRARAEELLHRYVRSEEHQHVPMAAALVGTIRAHEAEWDEAEALAGNCVWEPSSFEFTCGRSLGGDGEDGRRGHGRLARRGAPPGDRDAAGGGRFRQRCVCRDRRRMDRSDRAPRGPSPGRGRLVACCPRRAQSRRDAPRHGLGDRGARRPRRRRVPARTCGPAVRHRSAVPR